MNQPMTPQHLPIVDATTVDGRFARAVLTEAEAAARSTMAALRRNRLLMTVLYVGLFAVGFGTAVAAVARGFVADDPADAAVIIAIAGLSAAAFFSFFLARPLEALERNSIHAQWLTAHRRRRRILDPSGLPS